MNSLNRFADPVFCITRLIVGLMFAAHGGQKVLGFPPGGGGATGIFLVGGWIELTCGLLVAFGFLTRIGAFVAAGEMAVAYFWIHFSHSFFAAKGAPINGESAVFYCWFFFFAIFYGAGRWSIDAMIGKGKTAAATSTA